MVFQEPTLVALPGNLAIRQTGPGGWKRGNAGKGRTLPDTQRREILVNITAAPFHRMPSYAGARE